jgi:hypothetical protein
LRVGRGLCGIREFHIGALWLPLFLAIFPAV